MTYSVPLSGPFTASGSPTRFVIDLAARHDPAGTGDPTTPPEPGEHFARVTAEPALRAIFVRPPRQIDAVAFRRMSALLAGAPRYEDDRSESFRLPTPAYGGVTTIFVRVDGRCWELADDIGLSHEELLRRVHELTAEAH